MNTLALPSLSLPEALSLQADVCVCVFARLFHMLSQSLWSISVICVLCDSFPLTSPLVWYIALERRHPSQLNARERKLPVQATPNILFNSCLRASICWYGRSFSVQSYYSVRFLTHRRYGGASSLCKAVQAAPFHFSRSLIWQAVRIISGSASQLGHPLYYIEYCIFCITQSTFIPVSDLLLLMSYSLAYQMRRPKARRTTRPLWQWTRSLGAEAMLRWKCWMLEEIRWLNNFTKLTVSICVCDCYLASIYMCRTVPAFAFQALRLLLQ